ncbi:MAG: hypothetical protein LQ341_007636 [Variospora aurantia]|nr:MAG: hypothetical protein LQ341_007636 [Variospora aurantia]
MTTNIDPARDWNTLDACYQQPRRPNFPIRCTTELRHPGLPDKGSNTLFRFPAYDRTGGGLHHSVALTACAIVAGNKFDGYLSSTATGPPVAHALNAVLPGPCYYFHPHPWQPDGPSHPRPRPQRQNPNGTLSIWIEPKRWALNTTTLRCGQCSA